MSATFTDDDVEKPVVNGAGEEVGVVASVEGDVAHVRPSVDAVDSIKSSIGWEAVADETRPLDGGSVREITDEAVRLEGDLPMDDESAAETAGDDPTAGGDDAAAPDTEPAGGSAGIEETEVAEDLRDDTGEETLEETDAIDTEDAEAPGSDGQRSDRENRETDRGMTADPTELVDENDEPGTRTGVSVDPTEDRELTDAAVDPEEGREPTDAAVDPDEEFEPTDAAVEPTDETRRTDAAVDPGEQPRGSEPEIDPDAVSDPAPADGDRGPTTEDARDADLEDGPEERRLDDRESDAESESESNRSDESDRR